MKLLAILLALATLLLCVVLPLISWLPLANIGIPIAYGAFAALAAPRTPITQRVALTISAIAVVSTYILLSPDPTGLNSSLTIWFISSVAIGFLGVFLYRFLRHEPSGNGPVA